MCSAVTYRLQTVENGVEGTQWGQFYPGFGPCCLVLPPPSVLPLCQIRIPKPAGAPLCHWWQSPVLFATPHSFYFVFNYEPLRSPGAGLGLDWGSGPGHICQQAPGWPFSQACPDNCHISAPAKQCGPHTSPSRGTWVLTTWTRGRYGHISTVLVLGGNNPKWYEHRVDPHCRNSRVSSEAPPHRLSKRCPQAVCSAASARENLWFFRVPDFHVLFQQLKGYCTGPKKHLHYKKVWNSKDNLFHIPKSKIMKGPWKKQTIFTIF